VEKQKRVDKLQGVKKKKKGEKRKLKPCREIFEAHVDFFGVFVIKPWL
jgi:hypothetical protein